MRPWECTAGCVNDTRVAAGGWISSSRQVSRSAALPRNLRKLRVINRAIRSLARNEEVAPRRADLRERERAIDAHDEINCSVIARDNSNDSGRLIHLDSLIFSRDEFQERTVVSEVLKYYLVYTEQISNGRTIHSSEGIWKNFIGESYQK